MSNMAAVRTMSTSTSTSTPSSTTLKSYPKYLFIMIILISFSNIVIAQQNAAQMLLDLKDDFDNTNQLDATWKEGTHPCKNKWKGVSCKGKEGSNVKSLNLKGYNLGGEFNAEAISQLRGLKSLDIGKNQFTGPIPDFSVLDNLKDLAANDNKFSGEIPAGLFATKRPSSLKTIDLSGNQLSGKIPESLVSSAPVLQSLQLQRNNFTGPVPLFQQPSLGKCNLAFNQLEGEIPGEMIDKFLADSFKENPGLCSEKIGKACPPPPPSPVSETSKSSGAKIWVSIAVVVVVILIATFFVRRRKMKKDDPFAPLGKNISAHDGMNMHKAMSIGRTSSINRRGAHLGEPSSRKGSNSGKGSGELIMVNDEKGSFGLPDLMKAAAEVLGNGGLGSAYKAAMASGVSVVVKRLRDMNKLHRDEFYMEMRHLGGLRHKNILPPLAYHYRKEEKLVVSEYVPRGSLLYLMHGDRGSAHSELTWPIRLKIIKGVAQGMDFLHTEFSTYELPHGNLKSSNILLSVDFEPLLNDYSFHPMFSTTQAAQTLFAYRSPEAILTQQVTPKSDVFCLGIVILEVLSGKFPSQYFNNQKGGTDIVQLAKSLVSENRERELVDPEIASAGASSMGEMIRLLQIGVDCITSDHEKRIHMKEATSRIGDIRA